MFRHEYSLESELARATPERYRLGAALARRAHTLLAGTAPVRSAAAALPPAGCLLLEDPTDTEALDDALERAVDALAANPRSPQALLAAGRLLAHYGFLEDLQYHPRPLRDALKLIQRAHELAPDDPVAGEDLLLIELLLRRDENSHEALAGLQKSGRRPWLHAAGRGLWFWMHENLKVAEEWFGKAVSCAPDDGRRALALLWQARALERLGSHDLADARMAEAVLGLPPSRLRLHWWSRLKFARKRYDEAWELNRRALTFGLFEAAQRWRQELLVFFRRLSFVPRGPFSLPEEAKAGLDGPFRFAGSDFVHTGDTDSGRDDDDEFVPAFRVNLFLSGEHLPVVSEVADPGASFEGRAKLSVRVLDPRTLEKRPLPPGERFKPGQYVMMDERAGTVFHVLLMKRQNLHNPYLDLPEDLRNAFDLDRAAIQRFENAPWDVRLMLADHGFDPLLGALAAAKLCDAFLRFAGGIGIDLETGMAVKGGDWRNESPQSFDIRRHAVVRVQQTAPGRHWLRSFGLCKFLRPELELCELPQPLVEGARSILFEAAQEAALGALFREGDQAGSRQHPLALRNSRRSVEGASTRAALELVDTVGREGDTPGAVRGIQALMHILK